MIERQRFVLLVVVKELGVLVDALRLPWRASLKVTQLDWDFRLCLFLPPINRELLHSLKYLSEVELQQTDSWQPQLPELTTGLCPLRHTHWPYCQKLIACISCCCHVAFAHLQSTSTRPCARPRPRARPWHLHAPFCVAKYMCKSVPNDTPSGRRCMCVQWVWQKTAKNSTWNRWWMHVFGKCIEKMKLA